MKADIKTNFRGLHARIVHRDDANRQVLVSVLAKLGLTADPVEPTSPIPTDHCDLIFFDVEEGLDALAEGMRAVPHIAIIGNEAPSRLARAVRLECVSHILKPIRGTGVFTALLLAVNEHQRRQREERKMAMMRQRMAGRREVIKAVIHQMALARIDEDAAYESLRLEAMNRRVPIDQIARERLGLGDKTPAERPPRVAREA